MIDVSQDYKDQVVAGVVEWKPTATIDYTDYNLDNSISPSVNDNDRLSDESQISDGIESPTFKWQSWNYFEWGKYLRSENPTENEKGALSNRLSDPNSAEFSQHSGTVFGHRVFGHKTFTPFVDYPKFTVNFLSRTVSSLKVIFDDKLQEWGVDFDINVYVDNVIDTTENITGNTSIKWITTLTTPVLSATAIEVVVKKWNLPGAKAKIIESFTSIRESYDNTEIISMRIFEEADPENATIPIGNITSNNCNLTLVNLNSKFDNDNPESVLAGNIIKNRRITPSIQLNDLVNDMISLGIYYSLQWKIDNEKMTAEVIGQDIISLMEDSEYTKSQFITPGIDQDFTYTTTADFNIFTLDNIEVGTDQLIFSGEAVQCEGSEIGERVVYDHKVFGGIIFNGAFYCGTAEKQLSFTYTEGTTVTVNIAYNGFLPVGSNFRWFISYKTIDEFNEFTIGQGFSYTPEDPNDTSQNLKLQVLIESQSTTIKPTINDITVTISEKVTLYSVAALIIEDFDDTTGLIEGNYEIDQAFAAYEIPNAYILPQTYRSALKLICEAGAGRAFSARDGKLTIETLKTIGTADKTYTSNNVITKNNPVNEQSFYNRVIVKINPLEQNAAAEKIASIKIDILDTEVQEFTIEFKKQPADTIALSGLPGGVTATNTTYYIWGAIIELTNVSGSDQNFTLEINGKVYEILGVEISTLDDTESIRLNGIIEYIIDNPLIQTQDQADQVATIMINSFGQQKREIDLNVFADPAVEVGDSIDVYDNFFLVNNSENTIKRGTLDQQIGGKR